MSGVAVEHSTVNHKDGLAITGKAPIIRTFPLIPGTDLAGKVLRSEDPRFKVGDPRADEASEKLFAQRRSGRG
jgi:NADPH:quinone reductase-like Zn-dependent oxidoreductase